MSIVLFALFCLVIFTIDKTYTVRRSRKASTGTDVSIRSRQGFNFIGLLRPSPAGGPSLQGEDHHTVRVLLVDDHEIIRRGLAGILRTEPDLEVVGEAESGESAIDLARNMHPDVVLMDICMPGIGGVQATKVIHAEMPGIRVVGLSVLEQAEYTDAMREAGAVHFLTKGSSSTESVIGAIRACA
jgi:CheY-like chemotaxis protein